MISENDPDEARAHRPRQPPANGGRTSTVAPAGSGATVAPGDAVDQEAGRLQHQASRSPCRSVRTPISSSRSRPAGDGLLGRTRRPRGHRRSSGRSASRPSQPPIADIGRAGCRNVGSSMPCPARLPHIAARQRRAISSSSAPPRSAPRRSDSSRGEQAVADLAVGGQPGAVAVAAERPGHAADHADPGRPPSRRGSPSTSQVSAGAAPRSTGSGSRVNVARSARQDLRRR